MKAVRVAQFAFKVLSGNMLGEHVKGTLADVLERRSEIVGID